MYRSTLIATSVIFAAFVAHAAIAVPANAAETGRVAASAVAANVRYPCGYDGFHGGNQPLYNHCGRTDVVIRVHHFFWQTTYDCVRPGTHPLAQGTSQWRITSAEYDGHTCTIPGSVVGP
jgi:hypothetical protein